jgi:N-methylhydantoinase A/oxoprolinase/acetone carboxylase beta subunit
MLKILIPQRAGVLSAVGLLIAPPSYDIVKTFRVGLASLDPSTVEREYLSIEAEIERILRQVEPEGRITFERSADVAYVGQGYQVTVSTQDLVPRLEGPTLWSRFAEVYRQKYGYFYDDVPGELVALRVNGHIRGGEFKPERIAQSGGAERSSRQGTRLAYSCVTNSLLDYAVYDRRKLCPGMRLQGPALVEELSSTTVVDVSGVVIVDEYGSLLIELPAIEDRHVAQAPVEAKELPR